MRGGWEEAAAHAVLIRRWMAAMHAPDLLYDVVMMQRLLLLLLQKMMLPPPAAAAAVAAAKVGPWPLGDPTMVCSFNPVHRHIIITGIAVQTKRRLSVGP